MNNNGIAMTIILLLAVMLLPWSFAFAAADGFYNLSEVTSTWDGTEANRTSDPTADYNYTYGDEENLSYTLPWALSFYGKSYNQINADTNGNIWFSATGSAYPFNLAATGRGPVIAAWNNNLSSYYYGGVFIQHKTNPERVVIEWKTETYIEEGYYLPNDFEVVIYPNGNIRFDYKSFSSEKTNDFGSGISNDNYVNSLNVSSAYGNVYNLAGRSFMFNESTLPAVVVAPFISPINATTQTLSGILRGTAISVSSDTSATIGPVSYSTLTTWSCTISGLKEGVNNISITATDGTGNPATTTIPLVVDTAPPVIQISSPLGTVGRNPRLSFAVNEGNATVKLDGNLLSKVSGDTLDTLSLGQHILRVEAVDNAGNTAFAEVTFVSESIPPSVAITSPVSGLTSINTPLLAFAVTDGTVVVKMDGAVVNKISGANLDALADGQHTVSIVASNISGTANADVTFTVDTTPPILKTPIAPALPVTVAGSSHVVELKPDGSLWAWGANGSGQLGDGTQGNKTIPVQIGNGMDWATIAAGQEHTLAIKSDGTLWAWGANGQGQLGDGTTENKNVPLQIGLDTDWMTVSAGSNHTMALKNDGSLWAWGENFSGQLGDGTEEDKNIPHKIGNDTDWAAIAAGSGYTVALKKNGSLWVWGWGMYSSSSPARVGNSNEWAAISGGPGHILALKVNGTLWAWGTNYHGVLGDNTTYHRYVPSQIGTDNNWAAISAGLFHSTAIKTDGTFWAWGSNDGGQLGDGTTDEKHVPTQINSNGAWASVAAGWNHTVAVKTDGTIATWGENRDGQLGDGTTTSRPSPGSVLNHGYEVFAVNGTIHTKSQKIILKIDAYDLHGTTEMQFSSDNVIWTPPEPFNNFKTWSLSSGDGEKHIYARFKDATGNWSEIHTASAMLVTVGPSITIDSPASGVTGNGTPILSYSSASGSVVVIVDGVTVSKVSGDSLDYLTDGIHSVRIEATDILGNRSFSESTFIVDKTPPSLVTPTVKASSSYHTVAIQKDGSLWAWGTNWSGAIGDGTTDNKLSPVRIGTDNDWAEAVTGYEFTTALKNDGSLWAWGANWNGNLGDGTNEDKLVPTRIGQGNDWSALDSGYGHTLALKKDSTLWAWGTNWSGAIGDGTTDNRLSPIQIGTDTDWIAIAAGNSHSVALKTDGSLWAWGNNESGQLGDGTTDNRVIPVRIGVDNDWKMISAGDENTLAIKADNTLWAWGGNSAGQLGNGTQDSGAYPARIGNDSDWSSVMAGVAYTIALKNNGEIWSWGSNDYGMLGDGTNIGRLSPVKLAANGFQTIAALKGESTIAIKSDGSLWGWGYNGVGELGLGTTDSKNIPFPVPILSGSGLLINNGAQVTSSTAVVLSYLVTDMSGVAEMQFSNDNINWSVPEQFVHSKDWTLDSGYGSKTVYARFKDVAGNWSVAFSNTINMYPGLAVARTSPGTGLITSNPAGINCGAACSASFTTNSVVTLTATPDAGSLFTGWSGACSGVGTCLVTMDAAKSVTATFTTPPPTVSITSPVGAVKNSQPLLNYSVSAGTVVVKVDGIIVSAVSGQNLAALADGSHTVRVEATINGQTGFAESSFTVDTVAPAVSVNAIAGSTRTTSLTLTGTIETGAGINISTDHGATIGSISIAAGSWSCPVTNLAPGLNSFTITALDQATNSTARTVSVTYIPPLAMAVAPGSVAADLSRNLGVSIDNTTPAGSTVLIEQLVDINRNGLVDAGDYLIRSFKTTDGIASTAPTTAGDLDGTADSTIHTSLNLNLPGDLYHAPGNYILRATLGSEIATAPLVITPVSQSQSISGLINVGATPVPGALVQLTDTWQRHIAWAVADDLGSYVLNVAQSGDYLLLPVDYGHSATATPVTLTAGQNIVNHNLTLTAGTHHVTGQIIDSSSGSGIPGIWVQAAGTTSKAIAITDVNGSYDLVLPTGTYTVSALTAPHAPGASTAGYIGFENQTIVTTVTGNTTLTALPLTPGTIPVIGRTLDSTGTPVAGIPVKARIRSALDNRQPATYGISNTDGSYTLGLFSGSSWDITLDNSLAQTRGYIGTSRLGLDTAIGPLTGNDLTVHSITAWITGTVKDSANQILSGIEVRLRNVDSTITASTFSSQDGSYRIGTSVGTWYIDALTETAGTHPVSEQTISLIDGQIATINFVVDVTPPALTINPVITPTKTATQTITGTVEGGSTVAVSVNTTTVVGTVSYPTASTWSCPITALKEGANTITVTATDAATNTTTATTSITLDTVAPTVTITSPTAGTSSNQTPLLSYSVSDGTVVVTVDGITVTTTSGSTLGPLASGAHTVIVAATDPAGNVGSVQVSFTINQRPVFNPATISKPNATVGVAYTGQSIAGAASDPEGDTISYTKVSGPAWLSVAANGALSGTPGATDVGANTFTVRASATGGTADATLNITVVAAPVSVTTLNAWTHALSSTPNSKTKTNTSAGNITVGTGSNRLLLVAVILKGGTAVNATSVSASLGGVALMQAAITANSQKEIVWVGYLKEASIGTGAKALTVSFNAGTSTVSSLQVKWASFKNVNQTTPIKSTGAANTATTSATFGTAINYVANGMTTVVAANGGSSANPALSATPAFTQSGTTTKSTQSSAAYTVAHTAAGSYAATTAVSWTGTTATQSGTVVVSLQP